MLRPRNPARLIAWIATVLTTAALRSDDIETESRRLSLVTRTTPSIERDASAKNQSLKTLHLQKALNFVRQSDEGEIAASLRVPNGSSPSGGSSFSMVQRWLIEEAMIALERPAVGSRQDDRAKRQSSRTKKPPYGALTLAILAVVVAGVAFYASRGYATMLSIAAFIASAGLVNMYTRATATATTTSDDHQFPIFIAAVEFACAGGVAFLMLLVVQWRRGHVVPIPRCFDFLYKIVPIAVALTFSIGTRAYQVTQCSDSFLALVSAFQPLMALAAVLLIRIDFDCALLPAICCVVIGSIISQSGQDIFCTFGGLVVAVVSAVLQAFGTVLQQSLLLKEESTLFVVSALCFWLCVPTTAFLFALSAVVERAAPYHWVIAAVDGLQPWVTVMQCSVVGCCYTVSQVFVVGSIGAVASQVVGDLARVLVVLWHVVVYGTHLSCLSLYGNAIAVVGCLWFAHLDKSGELRPVRRIIK